MIGNKLAPFSIATVLGFQDTITDPDSTGQPDLYNKGGLVYFRDSAGVLFPLVTGADGAGVVQVTGPTTYVLQPTDRVLIVDTTAGAVSVTYPAAGGPFLGRQVQTIDAKRQFAAHNCTLNGNGNNIGGAATLVLNAAGGGVTTSWGGTTWEIDGSTNVSNATGILPLSNGGTGADLSASTANATSETLTNNVANGGTAKAFILNNATDLTNASAEIVEFQSAGARKAAVLGGGGLMGPTAGPSATQQHTLPAVASGTIIVSGASALADLALQIGDGTHRLASLGIQTIYAGGTGIFINQTASDQQVVQIQASSLATAGNAVLGLSNSGAGAPDLLLGVVSAGQSDAFCFAELLTCSGTVAAGQVVVWTGAKLVAAAAATANLTTIAGVAVTGGTGTAIVVARRGRVYTNAVAGITVGQLLGTSGTTAGSVVNATPGSGALVGRACEATGATVSGKVLVDLVLA
jgi:hypothetical protein